MVCDLLLVFLVFLPWIILQTRQPYRRGFFCGDTSLAYPFRESTVPSSLYVGLSIALPILAIIIMENLSYQTVEKKKNNQMNENTEKVYQIGKHKIPPVVIWCYCNTLYFLLGAAINQTVTNIAKYSLGRLRPHFFVVCEPDYASISCIDNHGNPQYITEYVCLGTHDRRLKQMRLSFPSGHSSLTSYSAVFLVLYLQTKLTWKYLKTLKTVLQAGLLFGATAVCVSRISDYKHHWSDVVGGVLLGVVIGLTISVYVAKFFKGPSIKSLMRLINVKMANQSLLPTIAIPTHQCDRIVINPSVKPNIPTAKSNDFTGSGALF